MGIVMRLPWVLMLALLAALANSSPSHAKQLKPKDPQNLPGTVYWCPDRTADQRYTSTPEPGCTPLVDKEDMADTKRKGSGDKQPIAIQNIQNEASKFIRTYGQFLDCCVNDADALDTVEELQAEATDILRAIQETGLVNMAQPDCPNCRGWTLSEIIGSVAMARDDLRKLKRRLKQLETRKEKATDLGHEAAARENRGIADEQDAISREFRSRRPPASAPTGTEIENTTLRPRVGTTIEDTTLPNAFGAEIGDVVSPGSDQRSDLNPRRGLDTQDTSLPTRAGTATQDSTLPSSIGFDIGNKENPSGSSTTPSRVGPNIGDSSLNERR